MRAKNCFVLIGLSLAIGLVSSGLRVILPAFLKMIY